MVPQIQDADALISAGGRVVGATIMPHAIYLHSSLMAGRMPTRDTAEKTAVIRYSNIEVLVALGFRRARQPGDARQASMFHTSHPEVAEIETAYRIPCR